MKLLRSVAPILADNPNGNKTLLFRSINTLLVNGEPAVINDLIKLRNNAAWLVFFLVDAFDKIPLFSKILITFT